MERQPPHVGTIGSTIADGLHMTIYCDAMDCRNNRALDLDEFGERYGRDMRVADFVGRSRCSRCGARWPKVSIRVAPIQTGGFDT
jgi:hypothetical protein